MDRYIQKFLRSFEEIFNYDVSKYQIYYNFKKKSSTSQNELFKLLH